MTDYTWYFRSNGKGTFATNDPVVTSGAVSNASRIMFGTFSGVSWSINTNGKGWVYFSVGPAQFGQSANFKMCVTEETNIARVDANDLRWHFRGRPAVNVRALIKSQTPRDGK